MKKVFLVFGIFSFGAVSAQEKEVFDIQQHLLQKQVNEKKAEEKNIPVLPFTRSLGFINLYKGKESPDSYTSSNGDKIILLSQDRMPCVQPDMRQFRTIPNPAYDIPFNYSDKKPQQGQIPNGSVPFSLIVTR